MKVTKKEARIFLLTHHGLLPPRELKGLNGIISYIQHVGCIQFDPINIVGRNPDLVLQSRVRNYKPGDLDQLLYTKRLLIDGWDKMASIYATKEWSYFKKHRDSVKTRNRDRIPTEDAIKEVLTAIKNSGPLSSIDFTDSKKVDWYWGPTKEARAVLEHLYAEGRIGIDHRVNNRRIFDLIENLLPKEILENADSFKGDAEYWEWHIHRRIGSMGLADSRAGEYWLGILGAKSKERKSTIDKLLSRKKLVHLEIDGINQPDFFIRIEDLPSLLRIKKKNIELQKAAIIAPLDNFIWNRRLIHELFDFKYVWEVYKPKNERIYGYYVLPIIYQDRFIARFEPGFDKRSRKFTIKGWWWEHNIIPNPAMFDALVGCFHDFLNYLDVCELKVDEGLKDEETLSWIQSIPS